MLNNPEKFIRDNSPDGGFLQSEEWRKFQEAVGRRTYNISSDGFWANIIEHSLPVVGKYFYVPRGPVMQVKSEKLKVKSYNSKSEVKGMMKGLVELAEEKEIGWIRIELGKEEILENIKDNIQYKITKAPHDVQPKEVFIMDIIKTEEDLLAAMKSKTRYNIRLADKKGVIVREITNDKNAEKYIAEFLRLVKITAKRDGITSHPESYYRKMLEIIPSDILKLYVAEYDGKVLAANLVLFYGDTCTYMHGASDDEARNVMAPYLLQWQQIKDAKKAGCKRYDFGGVSVQPLRPDDYIETPPLRTGEEEMRSQNSKFKIQNSQSWVGITRFKTGFSPKTVVTDFPGSYDIIINPRMYWLYRGIQKVKSFMKQ